MARKPGASAWTPWRGLRLRRSRAPQMPSPVPWPPAPRAGDLEACARELALRHRAQAQSARTPVPRAGRDLVGALSQHERDLRHAYALARAAVSEQRRIEPAAEWLLDNFQLVRAQLRTLISELATRALRRVPRVHLEKNTSVPRVLDLARECVAWADGRVESEQVERFLTAYQQEITLDLAELWTLPTLLQLALVERLSEGARTIAQRLEEYASAEYWAGYLIRMAGEQPGNMLVHVADMARLAPAITPAWAAEFHRLLEGKHPSLRLALSWAEQQLDQRGLGVARVIDEESRAQAADQVSIANCINSMRLALRNNWSDVIEKVSAVDRILAGDPARCYARMDFTTRGVYRHAVEMLARRARLGEAEVALRAVAAAKEAGSPDGDPRVQHVGYYLIGSGRAVFERGLAASPPPRARVASALRAWPATFYLGALGLFTAAITFLIAPHALHGASLPLDATMLAALFVAASQPAVAVVNWLVSVLVPPRLLPRMSFSGGIPDDSRTLVVVPWLLGSQRGLAEQLDALEIRYLGNRDANLHFALLTDFPDAPQRGMPGDDALLVTAIEGIDGLNAKYPLDGSTRFHLFHRPREWNERERTWMGHERKRGKLGELNRVLRGGPTEGFSVIVGDLQALQGVRYVITLDADTLLPPQTARRLIGTMAHPLNRPWFNKDSRRVTAGYGILQPRVSVARPERASQFARLFSDDTGLDPYTRAVSDVYQDLFGEASFVGKGIYDVDAFMRSVGIRFPNDLILSHDLLEGSYARTGLVSDVELIEHQPNRYSVEARRRHRWTRGDWQIVQWLLPIVPGPRRRGLRNTLKAHHRWKILDNLRRGVVPLAMMVLLLRAWWLDLHPVYWTIVVVAFLMLPPLFIALAQMARNAWQRAQPRHWRESMRSAGDQLLRTVFAMAVIPFEAFLNLDAILRSAWRLLFSRRRLLEWTPMEQADRAAASGYTEFLMLMWVGPACAVVSALALWTRAPAALISAAPLLVLWFASPWLAAAISREPRRRGQPLDARELRFLGSVARRTWHWFETFVNADDHWLPPDNYQEFPVAQVAHRTSPTNIGMTLLANLAARDFGYIGVAGLLERTRATLDSMDRLQRHRGHFYNWYDTQTLEVLSPRYVSTVDSGNLTGCLLVLACGLEHMDERPLIPRALPRGLAHTAHVIADYARVGVGAQPHAMLGLNATLSELDTLLEHAQVSGDTLPVLRGLLARIEVEAARLDRMTATAADFDELREWIDCLRMQCTAATEDLDEAAPWLALGDSGCDDQRVRTLLKELESNPSRARALVILREAIERLRAPDGEFAQDNAGHDLAAALEDTAAALTARQQQSCELAARCRAFAEADMSLLWDRPLQQFAIGFDVEHNRRDEGRYDLLASEARLASYMAIAQNQVPESHWFALGRMLTRAAGHTTLVSWSGSMFEYLMPQLLMPSFDGSLLDESCRAAVAAQIAWGVRSQVPWGISESAYNTTDAHLNYQYRAFGVPGLGLKHGLGDDLVVAPYACAMALMLEPAAGVRNLQALQALGALTRYGFYEALDYTEGRVAPGQSFSMVRSFMAHHHGMSFLALCSLLLDQPMQRRFMREPMLQAYDLLLREKMPAATPARTTALESESPQPAGTGSNPAAAVITRMDSVIPRVHLLSNGRYHVLLNQSGAGYSAWRDFAITRWSGGIASDGQGTFCYLRDVESGKCWSTTWQPCTAPAEHSAIFSQARAEFRCVDQGIESETLVAVSAEDDIELRRVRLTNRSSRNRTLDVTSYAELALNDRGADAAHPAFSRLFVETGLVPELDALLASRRPRASGETQPWLLHQMHAGGAVAGAAAFETDREKFLGRLRTAKHPAALDGGEPLGDSAGAVLDPCMAIRRRVQIPAGRTITVDLVTGIAPTRDEALALAHKYREPHLRDRVFELAWTHEQVVMQQLNVGARDAQQYEYIAARLLYSGAVGHVAPGVPGKSALWKHGLSGDLPIVLVRIANASQLDLVRQLVKAHGWWASRGLHTDLLIWNEEHSGYRQELQEHILYLIASAAEARGEQGPGRMYAWRVEHLSGEDCVLMEAAARWVFNGDAGRLRDQVERAVAQEAPPPAATMSARKSHGGGAVLSPPEGLEGFNGYGGHDAETNEYVIWLPPGVRTPAPWCNVLSNERFGSVVSETGGACTFSENAHEFRLTPWRNDPLTDACGEAIWLRDEETGEFWSPTPMPTPGSGGYRVRHGFGCTRYEHVHADLHSELDVFIAQAKPVKLSLLKLRNNGTRTRRVSATGYVEWVLGEQRAQCAPHVRTRVDEVSGANLANNSFDDAFASRVAFHALDPQASQRCLDSRAFIGRNRSQAAPVGMAMPELPVGSEHAEPCSALRADITLLPGQTTELVFALGAAEGIDGTRATLRELGHAEAAHAERQRVREHWGAQLRQLIVHTPEAGIDRLVNGWLPYQVLSARVQARSGYYQSGGAWGFRDQLQDVMALLHARPDLARAQLLRCASRQFREGDVQHWWHPPAGKGVRTHISDDYLWLPWAVSEYVAVTGDAGVLDEIQPFLEGREPAADEESVYELPQVSLESGSLYEHCVRAIRRGLRFGAHGLPLIGGGDWNDGMNRLGAQGRGESVWLAFFLLDVLARFAPIAESRGDAANAWTWHDVMRTLRDAIEEHAWDGEWYRRAWADDGTPMGSAQSEECRIDSLPQSWAVLADATDRARAASAMTSVLHNLVRDDLQLVQLFDPPFDKSALDPGYIKGYVPGVRENGGQYTHAAVWVAMALAKLGWNEEAWAVTRMLDPLNHAPTPVLAGHYRVEPYVLAADIYTAEGHAGRGGWTWYTGSAGWMYRLLVESLLGLQRRGTRLSFAPCVPADWQHWSLDYRFGAVTYRIAFERVGAGDAVARVELDGNPLDGGVIELHDDGREHVATVWVGKD